MSSAMRRIRRGWTLVECCICITIGTIVFASAVELLGLALRTDSSGGRGMENLQTVDRLAEQFRADARSANEVIAPARAQGGWTMKLPDDRRVEYTTVDQSVLRTEYRADKIVNRDAFALGDELNARVELRLARQPAVAELVLSRVVDGDIQPADEMRMAAPIGSDRRFERASQELEIGSPP